jgi:hypothetical protein
MTKNTVTTAFKGFDKEWKCRGYQYEVGGSYEHKGSVEACSSGFHACEYPLDVFGYYAPNDSRFAAVELSGELSRHGDDSKIAAAKIMVKAELKIPELVARAIDFIMARIESTKEVNEERSHASNTGNQSAASNTGYRSAASNTGDYSAASNTGDYSAASNTGDYSAASNTGYRSAASNTGDYSAASNTGNQSAASNTGDYSAASNTGDYSAASVGGKHSVAMASGFEGKAKAAEGSAIVLCYRDEDAEGDDYGRIVHIKAVIAGRDGIKPDTWYTLGADGEFVEVDAEECEENAEAA